jgi:hypothetical protein
MRCICPLIIYLCVCFSSGDADRKHCKFKPDPNIPPTFSALNEDYVGSGWSRGHMAPAGNNKFSSVGIFFGGDGYVRLMLYVPWDLEIKNQGTKS